MKKTILALGIATLLATSFASANNIPKEVEKFAQTLSNQYQNQPYAIKSVGDGSRFYQVKFGPKTIHITSDARYVIEGNFYDTYSGENLTDLAHYDFAKETLGAIPTKNLVSYQASNEKSTIWVFSDPHCPYCKLFHKGVPELVESGVTVKYVNMPLQGEGSKGFETASGILCEASPSSTFDLVVTTGDHVKGDEKCRSLVQENMKTASLLGVSTTPTIFLANGMVLTGAYTPKELAPILKQVEAMK